MGTGARRAAPPSCDERAGCWVKVGHKACDNVGSGTNHCTACGGAITLAGSETAHLRVLDRIRRELKAEGGAMFDRVWEDAMDERLVQMRDEERLTFSKIAGLMGVTKSATIGRYNRLSGYVRHKRKREPPLGEAWRLTLCSELPTGLTEYVPVNPRAGKRAFT